MPKQTPLTATEIIKALGGATRLAPELNAKRSAVSNWPRYGIPAKFWPAVARLAALDARTSHITIERLESHTTAVDKMEAA